MSSCPICSNEFENNNPIKIIQGSHASLIVALINLQTRTPFDLTSATAISTCFYNADNTELMLSLTSGISILSPQVLGRIQIDILSTQTALLRVTQLSVLEITISISDGDPIKIQIPQAYFVVRKYLLREENAYVIDAD